MRKRSSCRSGRCGGPRDPVLQGFGNLAASNQNQKQEKRKEESDFLARRSQVCGLNWSWNQLLKIVLSGDRIVRNVEIGHVDCSS